MITLDLFFVLVHRFVWSARTIQTLRQGKRRVKKNNKYATKNAQIPFRVFMIFPNWLGSCVCHLSVKTNLSTLNLPIAPEISISRIKKREWLFQYTQTIRNISSKAPQASLERSIEDSLPFPFDVYATRWAQHRIVYSEAPLGFSEIPGDWQNRGHANRGRCGVGVVSFLQCSPPKSDYVE